LELRCRLDRHPSVLGKQEAIHQFGHASAGHWLFSSTP
jgi:hypothetical protein